MVLTITKITKNYINNWNDTGPLDELFLFEDSVTKKVQKSAFTNNLFEANTVKVYKYLKTLFQFG